MNSDFSDFIRFFPIFRLFPTFRLLDSTGLVETDHIDSTKFVLAKILRKQVKLFNNCWFFVERKRQRLMSSKNFSNICVWTVKQCVLCAEAAAVWFFTQDFDTFCHVITFLVGNLQLFTPPERMFTHVMGNLGDRNYACFCVCGEGGLSEIYWHFSQEDEND